ncbi:MAG: hypothetical protein YYHSYBAR_000004 [Candidatus Fervidibacter sacchari]
MVKPIEFVETLQFADWIKILPKGTFKRDGRTIRLDENFLLAIKRNFDNGVLGRDVPVNFEHQYTALGAAGWVRALEVREDGLYALIEWTDIGKEAVEKQRFKYVSVELGGAVDPKTGKILGEDVLTGIALTNRPFFKGLTALAAADPDWTANDDPLQIPIHEDRDREWDADASERRWRQWVSEKDPSEWGSEEWRKYRRRFLAYDRANPDLFGSYKLPVVDIVNGQPRVIFRAVVAVLAVLAGARGGVDLPSDVKERVRSIAERLRNKFEGGESMSEEKQIAHEPQVTLDPAKVVALEQEVQRLKAEQRKRQFADELSSLRFSEGKVALAPASRNKFVEVLAELNDELAGKLMDAIKSIQFVPLGESGFAATEPDEKTETLQSYAEKIARERNLNFIESIRIAASERPELVFSEYQVKK